MSHPLRHVHNATPWLALVVVSCTYDAAAPGETPTQLSQSTTQCAPETPSPTRLLRQLSLDLRGAPPSAEELREVSVAGVVSDAMLNRVLGDQRFIERVKRWHADMLWPNLGGFWIHAGGSLVLSPPRTQHGIIFGQGTPERVLGILDRRSNEATCPAAGSDAHLTAAVCCTAAQPDHPACCLVRNRVYNPDDVACQAKARALPALFDFGVAIGDLNIRGGDSFYLGCDGALEYPPTRVMVGDRRWSHDATGRPYYTSPRSGRRRYYYDERDVPLPYDDAFHCPNFCRRSTPSGPGATYVSTDFVAKERTVAGVRYRGDGAGYACPAGFVEQANACDNLTAPATQARLWAHVEIRQEGAVLMRHWWSGNHAVNTCAYQAQTRLRSVFSDVPCSPGSRTDSSCGCGPDGSHCSPFTGSITHRTPTEQRLVDALNHEPLEIIGSVIDRDEDYFNILTTRRGFANGALAYMYKYQSAHMQEIEFTPPARPELMPDIPYEDATWHEYERGPQHAGVLTTAAYLGRFPTWRARINRFRTVFACHPFVPPDTPPPAVDDPCNREPDLARRCGCQNCHTSIEPLGLYWGRWAERSTLFLDPREFPAFDAACAQCASPGAGCPAHCRHYVYRPAAGESTPFLGYLSAWQFRSREETEHAEQGPAELVRRMLPNGSMQACAARTVWARLLNRPMSTSEQQRVLPSLVRAFEDNHHNYRALVRAIVNTAAYRRMD